jgi:hypothetical protein
VNGSEKSWNEEINLRTIGTGNSIEDTWTELKIIEDKCEG